MHLLQQSVLIGVLADLQHANDVQDFGPLFFVCVVDLRGNEVCRSPSASTTEAPLPRVVLHDVLGGRFRSGSARCRRFEYALNVGLVPSSTSRSYLSQ